MESHSKVKTKAENICDFFRGLSGKVEVVFEEGTQSAWLYKLLKPLVSSVTVCDPRRNKLINDGKKSDDVVTHSSASYDISAGGLVELHGHDLTREPIEAHKAELAQFLSDAAASPRLVERIAVDGAAFYAHACRLGNLRACTRSKTPPAQSAIAPPGRARSCLRGFPRG